MNNASYLFGLQDPSSVLGLMFPGLIILMIWSLIWKGMALWRAARHAKLYWFIALLVINTMGILDIIYLFLIDPKPKNDLAVKPNDSQSGQA